ncbi:MAG TPA: hypothetical protein VKP67_22580 [Xanthobacteraceae bacterium]|nr:hypothetical protein [Xanthobacteraceae bacterium]
MRNFCSRPDRWIAPALFVAGFVLVFRRWLFSGFDTAFGDEEDGYLALALIEHWRHVFSGEARWTDPIFFFPQRGVLGYTDAFFLFGLLQAPLRFIGVDAFTGLMLVMAGLAVVGFFGFRRLAVRHFGIPTPYAAIGAFLFAFANMDSVKLIHVQAYSAMLLPSLCGLVLSGWKSKPHGGIFGFAAGLLYAALFLTGFQTAWFFGCFILLLILLHPVICGFRASRSLIVEMVTSRRPVIFTAAFAFIIGILPFLVLYVPIFLAGHSRDFTEVASNMPEWRDLANITPENAAWGGILRWLDVVGRPDRPVWEVELAFTPTVAAVFIVGIAILAARMYRDDNGTDRVFVMIGVAVIILWLLQMEYFGIRPWHAVWAAVPGAKAIRYTFRSQVVANLFVALVAARVLAGIARARLLTLLLCAFLIVEQVNLAWPSVMSRGAALAWIAAVPPPPAGCLAFYMTPQAGSLDRTGPQYQDEAVLFAEIRGIPTVNGYSSWFPDGWALDEPASPGYASAVRTWARRNGIASSLCGLDPRAGRWTSGLPPG